MQTINKIKEIKRKQNREIANKRLTRKICGLSGKQDFSIALLLRNMFEKEACNFLCVGGRRDWGRGRRPANTRRWANVALVLGRVLWRWGNIHTMLDPRPKRTQNTPTRTLWTNVVLTFVLLRPYYIHFQANISLNKIPLTWMCNISCSRCSVNKIIKFFINNIIFHSFEAENCVSYSSFKWMKSTHK